MILAYVRTKTAVRSSRLLRRKTRPKKEKIEHFESYTDFEPLINEAVENTETIVLSSKAETKDQFADFF